MLVLSSRDVHYDRVKRASRGTRAPCAGIAMAMILDIPFEDAMARLMAASDGRPGATMLEIGRAFHAAGFPLVKLSTRWEQPDRHPRTVGSAIKRLPQVGHFLIGSTGHVSAFIHGYLWDGHAVNRGERLKRKHCDSIWRVDR